MLTAPPSALANRRLLRLALDDRLGLVQRRDATCASLPACEAQWDEVYPGSDRQARCPEGCAARVVR